MTALRPKPPPAPPCDDQWHYFIAEPDDGQGTYRGDLQF
jgi:hypothetical protein